MLRMRSVAETAASLRTAHTTWWPARASALVSRAPMKPVAPVSSTFMPCRHGELEADAASRAPLGEHRQRLFRPCARGLRPHRTRYCGGPEQWPEPVDLGGS